MRFTKLVPEIKGSFCFKTLIVESLNSTAKTEKLQLLAKFLVFNSSNWCAFRILIGYNASQFESFSILFSIPLISISPTLLTVMALKSPSEMFLFQRKYVVYINHPYKIVVSTPENVSVLKIGSRMTLIR